MRFVADGPNIPHELLIARDEGRVVFFCGSGISRARAGLSDFFGLAEEVIDRLGIPAESPVRKILIEAQEIHERTGQGGLISADRIFGLLERDFHLRDIEAAVAQALKPKKGVDLSAHRVLLDLARTPDGKVRLVTTNFDRLFEDCNSSLNLWQPPRLPNPFRYDEMDGIIHLHGCVNEDYSGSHGEGFVLSSSEFGRAYLAEGWATEFFRQVLERFVVVFVGYTADDPPVQYLLEALNKQSGTLAGVYAFQSGVKNEANANWLHKGVRAISYSESSDHDDLWKTLNEWAKRARDPYEWQKGVIELAKQGPDKLQSHERGQVAHIVATLDGMRKFSEDDNPPSAEWLCVFDPYRRYAKPGCLGVFGQQGPYVDPFDAYGLDSDIVPKRINPDDHFEKREAPSSSWDCFKANRLDQLNLHENNLPASRGLFASNSPRLPARLYQLGVWISKIAHQPTSVWWAASQTGLHPEIQSRIQLQLERWPNNASSIMRKAWRYLFEAWENQPSDFRRDWYELKPIIEKDGWDSMAIRKFSEIQRPYLKAQRDYLGGQKPPPKKEDIKLSNMVQLDVEYPNEGHDAIIPDEWLLLIIRELRKNLELALLLETELGGHGLQNICPIIPDDKTDNDHYERTHGLSGCLIFFASLFERLIQQNLTAARQEFATWQINDETIFSRLRIWASGFDQLLPTQDFGHLMRDLSDDAFWNSYHQRDFLLVLGKRWKDLDQPTREIIEERLLRGRNRWEREEDSEFIQYRNLAILNRLGWMKEQGCEFTFDYQECIKQLQNDARKWKPEYAKLAAESMEGRGGWVKTETGCVDLLTLPLGAIIPKAAEMSGRTEDFLVEKDPFAGLSAEHPVRAFSALTHSAKSGEYPEWAWRKFLSSEARKNDKPKFSALLAERLSSYPDDAVAEIIFQNSDWLLSVSADLASKFPESFDKVVSKFMTLFRATPALGDSGVVRGNKEPDWATEAINSPIGKIAQALMNDTRSKDLMDGAGFPTKWLSYIDDLLSLQGNPRRYALVIFAFNMNWFYAKSEDWTESNMLCILDQHDNIDRNAIWSGFFWGAKIPSPNLYRRLKSNLLHLGKNHGFQKRQYARILAAMLLAGWGSIIGEPRDRFISNAEMRDVILNTEDDFRASILWHLEKWSKEDTKWAAILPEFLQDVWPLQKAVKTPTVSAQLCNLAFANSKSFAEISEIVLPLLTTISSDRLMLPNLRKTKDSIVEVHPEKVLALLYAVLPVQVTTWPYGIEELLHRIEKARASLRSDERLIELNRRWNAR